MSNFKKIFKFSLCAILLTATTIYAQKAKVKKVKKTKTVISSNNSTEPKFTTNTIVDGMEIIWGMDFLPNGDIIFNERKGTLHRFSSGNVTDITGLPAISAKNQGGFLDIKVHPNYAQNGWIYANFSAEEKDSAGAVASNITLVRFKLENDKIANLETIFKTIPTNKWRGHYGGRIEFDKDNMLFFSVGEGGSSSRGGKESANQNAQNVKNGWGKVHRMYDDGRIPADNPILPGNTEPSTIWSYGHRNPQGLIMNQATQELYEVEHGPKGGDELNLIKKGNNYGWPWISYGVNYDGVKVTDNPTMEGMTEPIHYYVPSIATSSIAIITSDKWKSWKGDFLIGGLAGNHLSKIVVKDNKFVSSQKLLEGNRVRDVKQGPDGNIYVAVENPGRILQLIAQ
jgi:aldose sugar dehydrogenase